MFESDLPDTLIWNPEFDVNIAYQRFKEVFTLLLEHGANTDIPIIGKSSLHLGRGLMQKSNGLRIY